MVKKYTKSLFLFMILLTINFTFWQFSRIASVRNAENNLVTRTRLQAKFLSDRLDAIEDSLRDAERFFRNSSYVERSEFRDFMETGPVDGYFYVERVKRADLPAFENQVRQDKSVTRYGYPYFKAQVNELSDTHYLVKYFEPHEKWISVFGYDFSLDDRIMKHLGIAASERKTVLTEGLPFFNGTRMFAIHPISGTGRDPEYQGFIVAVLKGDSLFDGLIDNRGKSRIEVYAEESEVEGRKPFYTDSSSVPFSGKEQNVMRRTEKIRFFDTVWTMQLTVDAESALLNESSVSDAFFIAITAICFLLFSYRSVSFGTKSDTG